MVAVTVHVNAFEILHVGVDDVFTGVSVYGAQNKEVGIVKAASTGGTTQIVFVTVSGSQELLNTTNETE